MDTMQKQFDLNAFRERRQQKRANYERWEVSEDWRKAHERRYEAAIAFIEACYQADVTDGVWERMKAANAESEAAE